MFTITVEIDGTGNLSATFSPGTFKMEELRNIAVVNQVPNSLWMCQVSLVSDVAALSTTPAVPFYGASGVSVPASSQQTVPFAPANNKVYLGFIVSPNQPTLTEMQQLFAPALASNDAWFLNPPAGPIVPLRVTGCVDVALTDQTDPNPPHNVHPKIADTLNYWDANNALMWIENGATEPVIFYVEIFHTENSPIQAPTFLSWPLEVPLSSTVFPFGRGGSGNSMAWYGFAFAGKYATPQDYFEAHPAGGGHHTQELPPTKS